MSKGIIVKGRTNGATRVVVNDNTKPSSVKVATSGRSNGSKSNSSNRKR